MKRGFTSSVDEYPVYRELVGCCFEREARFAIEVARYAVEIVLSVYRTSFDVKYKQGREPVTEADRRTNAWIVEQIRDAFPNDGVVAEESVQLGEALRQQVDLPRVWFVDPVDGTAEFVARNGEFSVMIGLAQQGRPAMGVVAVPQTGELCLGIVGKGAWFVDEHNTFHPVQVSSTTSLNDSVVVMSRSHGSQRLHDAIEAIGPRARLRCGSVGIKSMRLATRQADIYMMMNERTGAKLWDGCAPEAIVIAAGGQCSDIFGEPINYATTTLPLQRGYVCTNGHLHALVLDRLRPLVAG